MKRHSRLINRPRDGEKILDLSKRPITEADATNLPLRRKILIDREMVPETGVYQAMHIVDDLQNEPPHYQRFHSHDFVETYLFLGSGPEHTGLTAEVTLEDECHRIESPASVYIPAGMKHRYKMVKGTGILIITALKETYSYQSA